MAERIVSPGVFTRENDLSFLAQGVGEIGAAFVGPFKEGPAFIPTIVRTQTEFESIFGRPDGTYYTEYAVQNYLREAGTATIVRVMGLGGYEHDAPIGIYVESGSEGSFLAATLHSTADGNAEDGGFPNTTIDSGSDGLFNISGSELGTEISASVRPTDSNSVDRVFGTSALGSKNAYVYTYFPWAVDVLAEVEEVQFVELPTQDFTEDANRASTPWVVSQEISGTRYELFRFRTIGHGNVYNRKFKVSISNVTGADNEVPTFTVTIRDFNDTDRRKNILETYNNVNLDPTSPNYIARVIGDRYYDITNGKIREQGEWGNRSRFVFVEVADPDAYPMSAIPFGHRAYYNPVITNDATGEDVPPVVYQSNSDDNTPTSVTNFSGIDLELAAVRRDNHQYLKPLPAGAVAGANEDFAFDVNPFNYIPADSDQTDIVKRQFTLAFQGGFDGKSPAIPNNKGDEIDSNNSQGFDLSPGSSGSLAYSRAIRALSNADEWDINMLVTPGVIRSLHSSVVSEAVDMVEARGDAFYIVDVAGVEDSIAAVIAEAADMDTNYAGTYFPWVRTIDVNTNKLTSVPPSVLMPAVYASNDRISAEWFAPAGLNRGGIIGAVSAVERLTHTDRDVLYENKINPIATFPGQGVVAWGQKTLQDRSSALDRINVRRLLINLKKFVASTSRFLVFEQNTATTRNRFINTVTPYMEAVQQRQGLYAFRVVMDESNNTPDVIDRNILAGQIFLQPARAAEFIVIDFNILPTGATFGD